MFRDSETPDSVYQCSFKLPAHLKKDWFFMNISITQSKVPEDILTYNTILRIKYEIVLIINVQ